MTANTHISYIETGNHSIQRDHVGEPPMGRWTRYEGVSDERNEQRSITTSRNAYIHIFRLHILADITSV